MRAQVVNIFHLHASCPHGCSHPQSKELAKVRYGYHLVTDCRKASQGNKSHKDVEATIIHHLNGDRGRALVERHASRHPPIGHHHSEEMNLT